jgi:hypothetical protein
MPKVLHSFGLPKTFPRETVPEEAKLFLAGLINQNPSPSEMVRQAEEKGYEPIWHALSNVGEDIYGFGLTVNGLCIPFMVKLAEDPASARLLIVH